MNLEDFTRIFKYEALKDQIYIYIHKKKINKKKHLSIRLIISSSLCGVFCNCEWDEKSPSINWLAIFWCNIAEHKLWWMDYFSYFLIPNQFQIYNILFTNFPKLKSMIKTYHGSNSEWANMLNLWKRSHFFLLCKV